MRHFTALFIVFVVAHQLVVCIAQEDTTPTEEAASSSVAGSSEPTTVAQQESPVTNVEGTVSSSNANDPSTEKSTPKVTDAASLNKTLTDLTTAFDIFTMYQELFTDSSQTSEGGSMHTRSGTSEDDEVEDEEGISGRRRTSRRRSSNQNISSPDPMWQHKKQLFVCNKCRVKVQKEQDNALLNLIICLAVALLVLQLVFFSCVIFYVRKKVGGSRSWDPPPFSWWKGSSSQVNIDMTEKGKKNLAYDASNEAEDSHGNSPEDMKNDRKEKKNDTKEKKNETKEKKKETNEKKMEMKETNTLECGKCRAATCTP